MASLIVRIFAIVVLVALAVECKPQNIGFNPLPAVQTHQQQQNYTLSTKSHTLLIGSRLPGDSQQYQERIYKPSKWLRTLSFEKNFKVHPHFSITQIVAEDQSKDGNGGYAKIEKGGIGQNNVTIKFKSQRSEAVDFIVTLFARPNFWFDDCKKSEYFFIKLRKLSESTIFCNWFFQFFL